MAKAIPSLDKWRPGCLLPPGVSWPLSSRGICIAPTVRSKDFISGCDGREGPAPGTAAAQNGAELHCSCRVIILPVFGCGSVNKCEFPVSGKLEGYAAASLNKSADETERSRPLFYCERNFWVGVTTVLRGIYVFWRCNSLWERFSETFVAL